MKLKLKKLNIFEKLKIPTLVKENTPWFNKSTKVYTLLDNEELGEVGTYLFDADPYFSEIKNLMNLCHDLFLENPNLKSYSSEYGKLLRKNITKFVFFDEDASRLKKIFLAILQQHCLLQKYKISNYNSSGFNQVAYEFNNLLKETAWKILKKDLNFSSEDLQKILDIVTPNQEYFKGSYSENPIRHSSFLAQLANMNSAEITQKQKNILLVCFNFDSLDFDELKDILGFGTDFGFNGEDKYGKLATVIVNNFTSKNKELGLIVSDVLKLACKEGKKSVPTLDFIKNVNEALKNNYKVEFKSFLEEIFKAFDFKEGINFRDQNKQILAGLVWILPQFDFDLDFYSSLGLRAARKIPGSGPVSSKIASSVFCCLAQIGSNDSMTALIQLKRKIKNKSLTKIIDKYLSAYLQAMGLTIQQLEEDNLNDFGLVSCQKVTALGDFKITTEIESTSKVSLEIQNLEGKLFKSIPAALTKNYPSEIKELKSEVKKILETLSYQKASIENYYLENREFNFAKWKKLFVDHGLMSFFGSRLVWNIQNSSDLKKQKAHQGVFRENEFYDFNDKKLKFSENSKISLWHPIESTDQDIESWENYVIKNQITQPFKQVFREIYEIGEDEKRLGYLSNRFAGNFVRQHQFSSLAKSRNWDYKLFGDWDDGAQAGQASVKLKGLNLEVVFKVSPYEDEALNISNSGVLLEVITDSISFYRGASYVNLEEIDPVVFSEIMRDCDLFTSVSSIGSDPDWVARAGDRDAQNYWNLYNSNIQLTAQGFIRKRALEKILPMLKIKNVAAVEENFLVIRAKSNTYKINLSTGGVFVANKGDRYLCIVPAASLRSSSKDLFLPFEGDQTFSLILSKAFLLAEEEKIQDHIILRQLRG